MKKRKKKSKAIKDLFLDRPTSHGGWPEGHPGSYTDPKTPVNKQIADYLKSMGLIDDNNPRARLSEGKVRQLIREVIEEARSKLNVLHPMYSPKFLGDPELVKKIDVLDDEDPDYADEFYHTLGVEKGTLQNPHRVKDPAMLSGISADDLDAYVYDAVNEIIESTFCHWISNSDGWEYVLDEYHPQNPKSQIFDLIDEIVEYAIDLSLQDFPGNKELRKAHILQHGQDPDHYARLKPSNILDEIDEYVKNKRGWCSRNVHLLRTRKNPQLFL